MQSVQVIKDRLRSPAPRQPKRPREDPEAPASMSAATDHETRLLTSSSDNAQRHHRQTIGLRPSFSTEDADASGDGGLNPFENSSGQVDSNITFDHAIFGAQTHPQRNELDTSARPLSSSTYDDSLLDGLFAGLEGNEGYSFGGGNGSDILQSMMAMPSANTVSPLTWGEWPAPGAGWRY